VIRHQSGLNTCPATMKSRLLVISKLMTIFLQTGLQCFQLCDDLWIVCKPAQRTVMLI